MDGLIDGHFRKLSGRSIPTRRLQRRGSVGKLAELGHRVRLFDIYGGLTIEANLTLFNFMQLLFLALTLFPLRRLESDFIYGFGFACWQATLASNLLNNFSDSLLLKL